MHLGNDGDGDVCDEPQKWEVGWAVKAAGAGQTRVPSTGY